MGWGNQTKTCALTLRPFANTVCSRTNTRTVPLCPNKCGAAMVTVLSFFALYTGDAVTDDFISSLRVTECRVTRSHLYSQASRTDFFHACLSFATHLCMDITFFHFPMTL